MLKSYNGHRSWNAWNVSLWINNDEDIYRLAYNWVQKFGVSMATKLLMKSLPDQTPDGAQYNRLSIRLAVEDMKE